MRRGGFDRPESPDSNRSPAGSCSAKDPSTEVRRKALRIYLTTSQINQQYNLLFERFLNPNGDIPRKYLAKLKRFPLRKTVKITEAHSEFIVTATWTRTAYRRDLPERVDWRSSPTLKAI